MNASNDLSLADCNHRRGFNLATSRYYCENCGTDWDSMKSKKILFCACFMVKTTTGWRADKMYFHHDNIQEARLEFFRMEDRMVREVVIAEAIGALAEDDNGDRTVM
jgi:hypothetical protein